MTTGFLALGQCWATVGEATDAYFSAFPLATSSASSPITTWFEKVAGVWRVTSYYFSTNQSLPGYFRYSVVAPLPTLPTCEYDAPFFDGMALGWGVAGAMFAAWAVRLVREQLR